MKKLLLFCSLIIMPVLLQAKLSDQEKFNLVEKFAPMLFFHPDDASSLTSAEWYIPKCSLENLKKDDTKQILVPYGSLTPQKLGTYKQDPKDGEYFLNPGGGKEPEHSRVLKGPGYEKTAKYPKGISDQHAYYNFVDISDNYVKISYWFFCAYQGNIEIVPGVTYFLRKIGAGSHEGDWEHIDVRLDKINGVWTVRDVFFARHGQEKGDLTKKNDVIFVNDQGEVDRNGTHPKTIVALNSHGTYEKVITFVSKDVDKTSDKGPVAILWGKDKAGKPKLEDYNKVPWSSYVGRWGADLKKKFGGSPEGPHRYRAFGEGAKTTAKLIVNDKSEWGIQVNNGQSADFKIEPTARTEKIEFAIRKPTTLFSYEIWKKELIGGKVGGLIGEYGGKLGEKISKIGAKSSKLYGPFLSTQPPVQVPANFKDELFIKARPASASFYVQVKLIE